MGKKGYRDKHQRSLMGELPRVFREAGFLEQTEFELGLQGEPVLEGRREDRRKRREKRFEHTSLRGPGV